MTFSKAGLNDKTVDVSGESLEPAEGGADHSSRDPGSRDRPPVVEHHHRVNLVPVGTVVGFNLVVFLGFGSVLMSLLLRDNPQGLARWWGGVVVLTGLQFVWLFADWYAQTRISLRVDNEGIVIEGRRRFRVGWAQVEHVGIVQSKGQEHLHLRLNASPGLPRRMPHNVEWKASTRVLALGPLARWESSERVREAFRDFSGHRWSEAPALPAD